MKKLEKNIKFFGVFAIATGTTISGGFFLLPGLAASEAGTSIILAYLLAAVPLVPVMLSQIELATAIPRAGGVYFFIDRTLGPYFGTIGGFGTWLALLLKVSFALIGMGAYLKIFFPDIEIVPVAVGFAILLGAINFFGSKKSKNFQFVLFFILMAILAYFVVGGISEISPARLETVFDTDFNTLFSTAGFVFMSYIGITKIISLAEEVKNPDKNLVRGVFWALGISILVYLLGLTIMVGVIPLEQLKGSLTPVALAAEFFSGKTGVFLVSLAALLSFLSVANAGILTASRYPLAMGRDHLLPKYFTKMDKRGTPFVAVLVTVASVVLFLIILNPAMIAKLTSTFLLLIFSITCFSVIIMRESRIESYDPGYRSPLYPWMQLFGIGISFLFIMEMGILPFIFSMVLVLFGTVWYFLYVRGRVLRTGAIYNVFERLGKYKYAGIDYELRDILKRKGLKKEDPFDQIIAKSLVVDEKGIVEFGDIAAKVSEWIASGIDYPAALLHKEFLDGTRIGATPVIQQIALPHLILEGLTHPKMALVRASEGVRIKFKLPDTDFKQEIEIFVKAVFFLVSPKHNPAQHLRILARIAGRVEEKRFLRDWNAAKNEHELKTAMLSFERFIFLKIRTDDETEDMIDKALKDIWMPDECLVAWVRRKNSVVIPDGNTVLAENDILTIVGEPESLDEIVKHFHLIRANYIE